MNGLHSTETYMKKLSDVIMESGQYGGKKYALPKGHKAGLRVPKGGSCCANCEYWIKERCTNKYYQAWAGTDKIPYPADEYCTDWWEPKEE